MMIGRAASFALLLVCTHAGATTVRPSPLSQRVALSEWVVHAIVRQVDHQQPFKTRYALELIEVLRGNREARTLEFTVPGGISGGREMRVIGMPVLDEGAEVIVLLTRTPAGTLMFTGLGQGVFVVQPEADELFKASRNSLLARLRALAARP
ncbi:MAG: hypothetical protein AAF654_05735 [Myxococcota bacterium]